jgi:hypothetical protein
MMMNNDDEDDEVMALIMQKKTLALDIIEHRSQRLKVCSEI